MDEEPKKSSSPINEKCDGRIIESHLEIPILGMEFCSFSTNFTELECLRKQALHRWP
jgi:hypothetical protein